MSGGALSFFWRPKDFWNDMSNKRLLNDIKVYDSRAFHRGLRAGFIKFGGENEAVLRFLHENPGSTVVDYAEHRGYEDTRQAGAVFHRLLTYRYIVIVGKFTVEAMNSDRSAWRYEVNRGQPRMTKEQVRTLVDDGSVRTKRYRTRKHGLASNFVFSLSGDMNKRLGIRLNQDGCDT